MCAPPPIRRITAQAMRAIIIIIIASCGHQATTPRFGFSNLSGVSASEKPRRRTWETHFGHMASRKRRDHLLPSSLNRSTLNIQHICDNMRHAARERYQIARTIYHHNQPHTKCARAHRPWSDYSATFSPRSRRRSKMYVHKCAYGFPFRRYVCGMCGV